ncbi:MAG: DUF167 domain-containing protein [Burkholderiaceae bacterium]|jgi:uncharacterized protein (TIGR00251 family)|nr:DUF167 domain-containing protein [Burkholderiaceae bacterium]
MGKHWLSETGSGFRLAVQISPNGKKSEILSIAEDAVRIRLQAQPVDGKANEALIRFVAARLDVPKSSVKITHGFTNRRKLLEISAPGLTRQALEAAFTLP